MRNDISRRKRKARRERIVMLVSSTFLLAAMAICAIQIRQNAAKNDSQNMDLKLAAKEESVKNKAGEIGQALIRENNTPTVQKETEKVNLEDDLDYAPMEAESRAVKIGKTNVSEQSTAVTGSKEEVSTAGAINVPESENAGGINTLSEGEELWDEMDMSLDGDDISQRLAGLTYSEANGLVRPIGKDIRLHYSVDKSIYFKTLDQYRTNPAVIFAAAEGDAVLACEKGIVTNIFNDDYLGNCLTIELGNGYVATYGQLKDLRVSVGDEVEAGAEIGFVAHASIYYSLEGDNLYFALTGNGKSVNPEPLFR